MLTATDKHLKCLKLSNLMQVSEFHRMVLALERFKEDLAVKSLTGKKNIRHQKTPDKVFFSVLEKMLLEVSNFEHAMSFSKAEQQLLSLQKVHMWFQSNKHVLMKSDGYFKAARMITEDIFEKQIHSRLKREKNKNQPKKDSSKLTRSSSLKTIDVHLKKLHQAERDAVRRQLRSESSMFARSSTQDLTSVDSVNFTDRGNFEEDLDFAREVYEHEYLGGNKIEHLNRPMTAPLKLKTTAPTTDDRTATSNFASLRNAHSEKLAKARPHSALAQVKHDLSWAKASPLPLTALIRRNAEEINKDVTVGQKKQVVVEVPTETGPVETEGRAGAVPIDQITDEKKIAKLVLFKQFCLEHAAQQENSMRQFTHHKHGTRQHFLEFPENRTENVVRQTATGLYNEPEQMEKDQMRGIVGSLDAYRGMSLEEFLDRDSSQAPRAVTAHNHSDDTSHNLPRPTTSSLVNHSFSMLPHPPHPHVERVVQPSRDLVKLSSLCELAPGTGKRMNSASEQALSAPKHGWRYPIVPIPPFNQSESVRATASGVVLALQEEDLVQHKVLIPLTPNNEASVQVQSQGVQADFINEDEAEAVRLQSKSPLIAVSEQRRSSIPSRPSTRPWSSPRYVTEVRAILRNRATGSRSCVDIRPDLGYGDHEVRKRSLRSAGTSGGASRPRTAASWGSYPAKSEVSRFGGAASHHSTGTLRHRSVAETMRVKSVVKRSMRNTSGRSSASSYVAQLREKKRAGARLCSQTKPTMRRTTEQEQATMSLEAYGAIGHNKPHLSFIQIASPVLASADNTIRTYVKPGGVYCGSTAAVVVASEGQVNIMDHSGSEGQLSYEDFFLNTPAEPSAADAANTTNDDWLSQWLTGGPLDGLHDTTGNGKATTYADLVSRAAILDSSDERSYSDEAPPSNPPMVDADRDTPRDTLSLSPKEDFSLSPRTDPLFSHRTESDEEPLDDVADDDVGHESDQPITSDDGKTSDYDVDQSTSSRFSSRTHSQRSFSVDSNEGEESEKDAREEKEGEENEEDAGEEHEDSAIEPQVNNIASNEQQAPELEKKGGDVGEVVESPHSEREADADQTLHNGDGALNLEPSANLDGSSDESALNNAICNEIKPQDLRHSAENTTSLQLPDQVEDQTDHAEDSTEKHKDADDEAVVKAERVATDELYEGEEGGKDERQADDSALTESSSTHSSYYSMTESETEMITDSSPVRIVVTSARKVERELQASRNEDAASPSSDDATTFRARSGAVGIRAAESDASQVISREEISAVVSLSRPQSGRPIPSVSEVRDPFVDMVASTRQRQIDRSVDVQTIFRNGAAAGVQPPERDEARKRLEQEAVVKMQRAYRSHLGRTRAARKCQGLSSETIEWARSYKATLMEKKEMRKRRLREARQSSRSMQRREASRMNRIGPHTDVFQIYHPEPEFPDPETIQRSALVIQSLARGWLVRRERKEALQMVEKRGSSLGEVVSEYRELLRRTQRRHGKLKPSLYFTYEELIDYLQQRTKFELVFKKREFWHEMESAELNAFFNDCGLFPSQDEITEAWESVSKSMDSLPKKKKHSPTAMSLADVIEVAFHIYVPVGARMETQKTRLSTWMTPIYNGEEGLKIMSASKNEEDSEVESADFEIVTKLVSQSFKDRKT